MTVGGEPLVTPARDKSLGTLFSDLAREAGRLIRQEAALARAEVVSGIGQAGAGAAYLAVGGALLYAALLAFMVAAGFALGLVLPGWAAALIVGGVVLIVGGILLLIGRSNLAARNLMPQRTLSTLREDAQWAKEQMR
ncbi:MAG: phage holin family protein [Stellaceae bacterium]